MKLLASIAVIILGIGLFSTCFRRPSETPTEIIVNPAQIGTKTDLFEVVAPNRLQLAYGVKYEVVADPDGQKKGFALRRANGTIGGYVRCECVGATTSSCVTNSNNPNHPACSGGCTISEGNTLGCFISDPLPGPPKTPFLRGFEGALAQEAEGQVVGHALQPRLQLRLFIVGT